MAKKHWIMLKRGLSEDPEHRERMGIRIWLFMHLLDRADWETGVVRGWRDAQEADDMEMPLRTLRDQREGLEHDGYITCIQRHQCQDVIIHNWVNPRNYDGGVMNVKRDDDKDEGGENLPPKSGKKLPLTRDHGNTHGSRKVATPTIKDHVTRCIGAQTRNDDDSNDPSEPLYVETGNEFGDKDLKAVMLPKDDLARKLMAVSKRKYFQSNTQKSHYNRIRKAHNAGHITDDWIEDCCRRAAERKWSFQGLLNAIEDYDQMRDWTNRNARTNQTQSSRQPRRVGKEIPRDREQYVGFEAVRT